MPAQIIIISGSPGTGKTSVSRMLAEKSLHKRAVHIQADDYWQSISKGYIHPWLSDSGKQNETVLKAVAASAKTFAKGGYEVFVDGVIGPWFIKPWVKLAKKGIDVRYIILRADEATTVLRATTRQQRESFPLNSEIIKNLWASFCDLGSYESHVLDTTGQSVEESAAAVQCMLLGDKTYVLK